MLIIGGILIGFFASLISALFGGGAGLITVPAVYWVLYHYTTYHNHLMQITITTGASVAIPLGIMSAIKHFKYGNVDKTVLTSLVFPLLFGAAIGAILVNLINSHVLKIYFGVMVLAIAIWVYRFSPERDKLWQPGKLILKSTAAIVGMISITLGVSVFTVPFLMKLGLDIKKAIGTSSVLVFIYLLLGALTLIVLGFSVIGIGHEHFGYLNIPILLSSIVPAMAGSMLGAKLVYILPQCILRQFFVAMMIFVGIVMLIFH